MPEKWPRDLWLEAIWEDEAVKPYERVVAHVYARYAGKGETTWCSWDELRRRTGIKSKDAIWRAVSGLKKAGWLIEESPARQHRSAVYRLTSPLAGIVVGVRLPDLYPVPDIRETDPWTSSADPEVRENVARGPAFCDQESGKRDAREVIENSEEKSELARASAPPPDGRRARWARGHAYEADPGAPGVCGCGLPQLNSVAHRRAS
jgi:biotin operon repressor